MLYLDGTKKDIEKEQSEAEARSMEKSGPG